MRVPWIIGAVAIVACAAHHTMTGEPVDLTGSIACGPGTCGDGMLCVDRERDGSDGSAHPIEDYSCVPAPQGCTLVAQCGYDCRNRPDMPECCSACISDICGPFIPSLDGRQLFCQGF